MIKIRCVVERITYQNPENGYSVLKVRIKGYSDLVPLVGNMPDVSVGSVLLADGNWKIDAKYGKQFQAEKWEETMPATIYGIEKYLGSGLIKGIGPKFAQRIVAKFGTNTIEIIETEINRLSEIEGIGQKRIQKIAESWERQKEIKNLMLFLQDYGVSTAFAAKIYKTYGNESIHKVKQNPYRLADDIWGIGFKTADGIAEKLGYEKESYERCRSGIQYTLNSLAEEGHVYALRQQLINKAVELLETSEAAIIKALDGMLRNKDLVEDNVNFAKTGDEKRKSEEFQRSEAEEQQEQAIYLPPFYYAEIGTAQKLKRLVNSPSKISNKIQVKIKQIEAQTGMKYDNIQASAIQTALTSKVMVLTGGPGTGKTTTTKGIITAFKHFGLKVILAAPTGRAAKRMAEATGMEAKTIHRLLECKPPEGYQKNEENPLDGDVLIVDESSMIDIILMNSLLKAIPIHMKLLLVGDIDQLPSVGAGNVLRDIIDSNAFPVVRLTQIFRQAQSSRIIMNAHRINQGQFPDCSNGKYTDFFFMEEEDAEHAALTIVELVKTKLPRYYHMPASAIQVLTPMQKGIIGASHLNISLQDALNPNELCLNRGGYSYRIRDKVMQIKNNYEKEVFNGDIGIIESINQEDKSLNVNYDGRLVSYDISELDELVQAYAITIHKSQGSEYPIVVMPVLMNHYVMLQRNLIYTGITRAKKILVIVGTKKALSYAVRNVTVTKRNTLLKERLEN